MARNKHPEVTVDKILEAAKRLFLEKGYDRTTIQDIVNELEGLTKGAVYYHFKSKEEIMNALEDKMFFDNNPFEMVKKHPELNALEKMRMLVKANKTDEEQIELMKQSIPLMKNPHILARTLESNHRILYPYCLELIEEGQKDGSIPVENAQVVAEFIVLINMWFLPSLFPGGNEEVRQRYLFIASMFEKMGAPIFDVEMEDIISTSSYFSDSEE
ncbi:TetR/AcrR family transcriptional regulator [Enterococcus sp. AZ109]|uniref:TetR/AcrR family transcriptional regulator n=1 Tax=Enterococcus sp. AZ109 TaxID=2774634 RepID=UPI003F24EBAB